MLTTFYYYFTFIDNDNYRHLKVVINFLYKNSIINSYWLHYQLFLFELLY
jgi:hypothetical protein